MPLLQKRIEIETLTVHVAMINLEKNADGQSNWDNLVKSSEADDAIAKPSKTIPSLLALILAKIDIHIANLKYHDQQQSVQYSLRDVKFNTNTTNADKPILIKSSFDLISSKPALSATVQFDGAVHYQDNDQRLLFSPMLLSATFNSAHQADQTIPLILRFDADLSLHNETATINPIELIIGDLQLAGKLEASSILNSSPSAYGHFKLQGKGLPHLLKVAELEPLAAQLARLPDSSVALDSVFHVDLAQGNMDIEKFNMDIFGNQINAEVYAHNINSKTPKVKVLFKASGTALPSLIELAVAFMKMPEHDLKQLSKKLLSAPKTFDIMADFDIDQVASTITIPTLSIKALGMTGTAKLVANNTNGSKPQLTGEIEAKGKDLPLLIQISSAFWQGIMPKFRSGFSKLKPFALKTQFKINLESGELDVPLFKANALGFNVNGHLKGNQIHAKNGDLRGVFMLENNNPKPFLTAIDRADLASILQSVSLKTDVNGNTTALNLDPFALTAVFAGKQIPNSLVKLVLQARSKINLEKEQFELKPLRLLGLGLDIEANIKAKQFKHNPEFSGQLSVAAFDLRQLLQTLNQPILNTVNKNALRNVALTTTISKKDNDFSLNNIKATLDKTQLQGQIRFKQSSPLNIVFDVDIDQLNLDYYLPPKKAKQTPVTAETVTAKIATMQQFETLRNLQVKGDLTVKQLVVSKVQLADVQFSIVADQGTIGLMPIKANLYGGTYNGDIVLNIKNAVPKLSVNTNFSNIHIEPLLFNLVGSANVTGVSNITLALRSSGQDINTLKSRLTGTGKIDLRQGALRGIDISSVLRQIEIMYESKQPAPINKGEQTPFDSLTANLIIHDGIIDNDDLLLSSPGFKVNGNGRLLELNKMTWHYDFIASVDQSSEARGVEQYNLGGYKLKINCRGKIIDKDCTPDITTVLQALLKNQIGKKIEKAIGLPLDLLPGIGTDDNEKQTTGSDEQAKPSAPTDPVDKVIKGVLDKLF